MSVRILRTLTVSNEDGTSLWRLFPFPFPWDVWWRISIVWIWPNARKSMKDEWKNDEHVWCVVCGLWLVGNDLRISARVVKGWSKTAKSPKTPRPKLSSWRWAGICPPRKRPLQAGGFDRLSLLLSRSGAPCFSAFPSSILSRLFSLLPCFSLQPSAFRKPSKNHTWSGMSCWYLYDQYGYGVG